jgi:hypothetical protein
VDKDFGEPRLNKGKQDSSQMDFVESEIDQQALLSL